MHSATIHEYVAAFWGWKSLFSDGRDWILTEIPEIVSSQDHAIVALAVLVELGRADVPAHVNDKCLWLKVVVSETNLSMEIHGVARVSGRVGPSDVSDAPAA